MAKFQFIVVALALLFTSSLGAALPVEQRSDAAVVVDLVPTPAPIVELESRKHHSHHAQHHHKSRSIKNGKVTYYAGQQLKNPRCPGHKNPNDNSMIAAVSANSPFNCGDRVKISHSGKSVVVTVIDRCAGCTADWIDVTKGVFRKMEPLEKGVIHHVSLSMA